MSAFTPEQLAYLEAHRDESRVTEIHWVYSIPIVFATISTSLRLWAKKAGRNGITLDDWIIVFATLCLIGECASGLGYGPPHGMGRHVVAVEPYDLMMVRKGDYVFSHFYDFALVTVKLGILAFYYRVFVVSLFRKFVVATAAFVIAWGIGITVTLGLACRPIEAFWDSNIKGDCLHLVKFTYFTNITNLITDIWIFLMPIPVIWHLQLQTKKKILLCLIFSIGVATCIVSVLRLTVVLGHGNPDFTWYYVPLGAYSAFEPLGGILATNLPIIWHMYRKRKGSFLPSFSKKDPSSTATVGTGESRRRRFARSLGLSNVDQTGTDSQSRTILDNEEQNAWAPEMQENSQQPRRAQFFGKVERVPTNTEQTEEVSEGADPGKSRKKSWSTQPRVGPNSPQGMKKNTWEVRKK